MRYALLITCLGLTACQAVQVPSPAQLGALRPGLVLEVFDTQAQDEAPPVPLLPAGDVAEEPPRPPVPTATPPSRAGSREEAPAPIEAIRGAVVGLAATGERAVTGAKIRLSDGREAQSDSEGRFEIAGAPPVDGAYTVMHPGYLSATVIGLSGATPAFHLQPRVPEQAPAAEATVMRVTLTGQVLDEQGEAIEGAVVVLQDPRGSVGGPVVSDEHGFYTMSVEAIDGRIKGGRLLAMREGATPAMGAARGINLEAEATTLPTLQLERPSHAIRVHVPAVAGLPAPRITVTLTGEAGERLHLPAIDDTIRYARLPGIKVDLDVEARDNDQGVSTRWHRSDLNLPPDRTEVTIEAPLLPPPTLTATPTLAAGATYAWQGSPGADGYRLALQGLDNQGFQWEAFTPEAAFTVPSIYRSGPGRYRLSVTAFDEPGQVSARSIASVGPRRLRLQPLAPAREYRQATRSILVTAL